MAFVIVDNQKVSDSQIKWKFNTLERVFSSDPERFERNVNFWRDKLYIGPEVGITILNGVEIVDAEFEVVEPKSEENEPTVSDATIESAMDVDGQEPSVSNDTETVVDTPKRKSGKKTV